MQATDMNGQPIEGTALTEEQKQAILDQATEKPKGKKAKRPKNYKAKKKAARKRARLSKRRNRK